MLLSVLPIRLLRLHPSDFLLEASLEPCKFLVEIGEGVLQGLDPCEDHGKEVGGTQEREKKKEGEGKETRWEAGSQGADNRRPQEASVLLTRHP